MKKRLLFRADTAGLGKYCTGGYGRIGVYRVNFVPLDYPLNLTEYEAHHWIGKIMTFHMVYNLFLRSQG